MSNKLQERPSHGIYGFLRTGKIKPSVRGAKRMQAILRDIEADLIRDLGGPEKMTTAQEVLVKTTMQAFAVLVLAGSWTQRYGVLRPDMAKRGVLELQPVLGKQYIAFLNSIRQNLMALGLDMKKTDDVLSLGKYIELKDAEKSQPAVRKTNPRARQGQGEAEGPGMDDSAGVKQIEPRATSSDISGHNKALIDSGAESSQDRRPEGGGIGQPSGLHNEGATDEAISGRLGEKDDPGVTHEV